MSSEEPNVKQLDSPPHPTAGWVVVAPFPRPDEDKPRDPGAQQLMAFGGLIVDLSGRSMRPSRDVLSGVLLEAGPTADSIDRDVLLPFTPGATVFYGEQSIIEIGGFHYLAAQSILAWDEAPA